MFIHLMSLQLFYSSFKILTDSYTHIRTLDIATDGFWGGCHERCYADIRVLNPFASTNSGTAT